MKCPMCGKGKMSKEEVPVERLGVYLGSFPAWVCNKCGENIMDSKEVGEVENRIKELGLWGSEPASVYEIGGNVAISLRKKVASLMGITKKSSISVIPFVKKRRLIIEITG